MLLSLGLDWPRPLHGCDNSKICLLSSCTHSRQSSLCPGSLEAKSEVCSALSLKPKRNHLFKFPNRQRPKSSFQNELSSGMLKFYLKKRKHFKTSNFIINFQQLCMKNLTVYCKNSNFLAPTTQHKQLFIYFGPSSCRSVKLNSTFN